jgi:ribosomal protein L11 methyltransferase
LDFIEIKFSCTQELGEMLMAELSFIGFDTFEETDLGINAYIDQDKFDEALVLEIANRYSATGEIKFEKNVIEKKNWNEEWEKNYDPIIIQDKCLVRASFHHIDKKYPFEIIIDPKMSFGTGHHETTSQVIEHQLEIDHAGKSVLDVGCGTGILAIMAHKLGAGHIEACDIDPWCIENSQENFEKNGAQEVEVRLGTLKESNIKGIFDIVIANINRNVLVEEIPLYVDYIKNNGFLLLSGFYNEDVNDLENLCNKCGLKLKKQTSKNKWAALTFKKD